jgi:hypothetical protein
MPAPAATACNCPPSLVGTWWRSPDGRTLPAGSSDDSSTESAGTGVTSLERDVLNVSRMRADSMYFTEARDSRTATPTPEATEEVRRMPSGDAPGDIVRPS